MTYVIERGIPVGRGKSDPKYPFAKMEIGDSFLVTDETQFNAVRVAAAKFANYRGVKLKTAARNQQDHDEVGLRVWRTA